MQWHLFTPAIVTFIHDSIIEPTELQGMAADKSLEGALSRVDFRIQYGMIKDEYDLAAAYAVAIAQGHCFNDANKRTAFATMKLCLRQYGIEYKENDIPAGDIIVEVAKGKLEEEALARWLRQRAG